MDLSSSLVSFTPNPVPTVMLPTMLPTHVWPVTADGRRDERWPLSLKIATMVLTELGDHSRGLRTRRCEARGMKETLPPF